jgi:secreted trypsin-like serine protease
MKEKADRLNGIAGTQEARDAIRRSTNRFTRQLQIAVNLPANERITNGKPAMPGQIPYQVALVFTGYSNIQAGQFCGGSVIDASWILTAAHCLRANSRPGDIVIFADSVKLSQGGKLLQVGKVVRHPQYSSDTQQNDVALLKLSTPIQNPHIVGLADNAKETAILANSSNATISGWGDTYYNSRLGSYDLLFAIVPLIDGETCQKAYPNKIFDGMVCAGTQGTDSCQGDSCGPMVIADGANGNTPYQEGIVSWGAVADQTMVSTRGCQPSSLG